jgi:CRISPR/Cas system CSM-associated protein Csm5 (group 7 of RAMP superfamily)
LFQTLKIDLEAVSYRTINFRSDPGNEVRPMIRNGAGLPYLPGTSIKGALRSVIFKELFSQVDTRDVRDDRTLENTLLGNFDKSIMRYVRVSDAYMQNDNTDVWYINLFNLKNNGRNWESTWKSGFNVPVELLLPETTSTFRLNLAKPLVEIIESKYQKGHTLPQHISKIFTTNPFENLRNIINNYTRKHIEKELQFLSTYNQAEDSDFLIENLEKLLPLTNEPNSCLFRMAFGSGFHGITGDWRFDGHLTTINNPDDKNWVFSPTIRRKEPSRYKSRKATGQEPTFMGFIKLTF